MTAVQIRVPGTLVGDKFRIIRLLGRGGMGVVYEVEHERLGKRYALKLLCVDDQTSPQTVERFRREQQADGLIRNAHVVETHDAGVLDTGEPFVVMELLEGETLASLIERKGCLELTEICDLIGQACVGVQAAHDADIIHRDLKPSNLFVTTREGKPFVKLLDFGISKFAHGNSADMSRTQDGTILGTPYYMAPEQIRGGRDFDLRVDVYALGVILYECAAGRVPYQADTLPMLGVLICEGKPESLQTIRADLPADFRRLVALAMSVERLQRIPSAARLGEALQEIGGTVKAPPPIHAVPRGSDTPEPHNDLRRSTEVIEEPFGLLPQSSPNSHDGATSPPPGTPPAPPRWLIGAVAAAGLIGAVVATILQAQLADTNKTNASLSSVGPKGTMVFQALPASTPLAPSSLQPTETNSVSNSDRGRKLEDKAGSTKPNVSTNRAEAEGLAPTLRGTATK